MKPAAAIVAVAVAEAMIEDVSLSDSEMRDECSERQGNDDTQ